MIKTGRTTLRHVVSHCLVAHQFAPRTGNGEIFSFLGVFWCLEQLVKWWVLRDSATVSHKVLILSCDALNTFRSPPTMQHKQQRKNCWRCAGVALNKRGETAFGMTLWRSGL